MPTTSTIQVGAATYEVSEPKEAAIFLITSFGADGKETERLVKAESAHKARMYVMALNKASADDVARVLGAGGKVEVVA